LNAEVAEGKEGAEASRRHRSRDSAAGSFFEEKRFLFPFMAHEPGLGVESGARSPHSKKRTRWDRSQRVREYQR
jgi:hypothetical protein